MSITPYITASIVIQLLGMIIPSLQKMMKEGGEMAKQKVNKYTKMLTLVLALVEALGVYISYSKSYSNIFINPGFFTGLVVVMSLIAGTAILIWLGEQITNKGIGNGISMIIFVGIISGFPSLVTTLYGLILHY
jgi:preprotein translocase subunit SecY